MMRSKYFLAMLVLFNFLTTVQPVLASNSCHLLFEETYAFRRTLKEDQKALDKLNFQEGAYAQKTQDFLEWIHRVAENPEGGRTSKTIKMMQDEVKQRHQFLFSHAHGAEFFHGSSAIALLAFAAPDKVTQTTGGLIPTGRMQKNGDIPFAGEMLQGVTETGVNSIGISITARHEVDMAIDYAQEASWSKEEATKAIEARDQLLQSGYVYQNKYYHGNGQIFYSLQDMIVNAGNIAEMRLKKFSEMGSLEKQLITESFPVLFGFHFDNSIHIGTWYKPRADAYESIVMNGVPSDTARVIFVPKNKIEFVKNLLGPNSHIAVEPIEPVQKQHVSYFDFFSSVRKKLGL